MFTRITSKFQFKTWKVIRKCWIVIASLWLLATICIFCYGMISDARFIYNELGEGIVENASFWSDKSLINPKTGKTVVKKLDWIVEVPIGDSITVYSARGKRGYVNVNSGELVTQPAFDKAWAFHDGLGAVELNGNIMFVKPDGSFAFENMYKHFGGDVIFSDGFCIVRNEKDSCGVIDTTGKWVIPPRYDRIDAKVGSSWFTAYKDYHRVDVCAKDSLNVQHPTYYTFSCDTILVDRDSLEIYVRQK